MSAQVRARYQHSLPATHVQLAADLLHVKGFPFVSKGGAVRNDKGAQKCDRSVVKLGHAIDETLLLRVADRSLIWVGRNSRDTDFFASVGYSTKERLAASKYRIPISMQRMPHLPSLESHYLHSRRRRHWEYAAYNARSPARQPRDTSCGHLTGPVSKKLYRGNCGPRPALPCFVRSRSCSGASRHIPAFENLGRSRGATRPLKPLGQGGERPHLAVRTEIQNGFQRR
jgi:hypothetical protein